MSEPALTPEALDELARLEAAAVRASQHARDMDERGAGSVGWEAISSARAREREAHGGHQQALINAAPALIAAARERDELRAGMALRVIDAGPSEDGAFLMRLKTSLAPILGQTFVNACEEAGAPNSLELHLATQDGRRVLVTVQRMEGLTPAQQRLAAEAERDSLRDRLAAAEKERDQALANHADVQRAYAAWIEAAAARIEPATVTLPINIGSACAAEIRALLPKPEKEAGR